VQLTSVIVAMRSNIGRTTERFVRSRVVNVIAGPQTVLTMSLLANRRARLAKDIFPAKHSPDWHQNDETRHELEKLYAEWGLDIRWLRGERSHVRAVPSRKKRRPRGKSRPVKQMSK
jgi:hypothetical protein